MKIDHYIQGQLQITPPENNADASIEINFEPNDTETVFSISDFKWLNQSKDLLYSYFVGGTTGGNGILEGVEHKIEIHENGTTLKVFNGFVDLTTASWERNAVTATSTPIGSIDWLNEVADGFDFQTLYDEKLITNADKVFIPYVINSIPNYKDIMIINLSLVTINLSLEELLNDLFMKTAEGTTVIDTAGGIIGVIFKIIWGILLLVSIVKLLLDLFDLVIQRIKYVAAMSVNTLLTAACQKLGYNFQSPLLQSNPFDRLYIIPQTQAPPLSQIDERIKGYLSGKVTEQTGYYKGTFGDLLRALQLMFNLRIAADDNTLKLLPYQKPLVSATFTLPRYDTSKHNFRTNADIFIANNTLSFQTDQTDGNTIDQWEGTNVQSQLNPKTVADKRKTLFKGLNRVSIPFARAYRKNDLTGVEKVAEVLIKPIGKVIGTLVTTTNKIVDSINVVIDKINNLKDKLKSVGVKIKFDIPNINRLKNPRIASLITSRIGMLLLEKDMIGVDKIALVDIGDEDIKNKISLDNDTYVRASYLWNNHYQDASFAPTKNTAQRYIYEWNNVEMNLQDVINVQNEGLVKKPTGEVLEVVSCKWNISTRLANFVVKERKVYSTNIIETITEPSGR